MFKTYEKYIVKNFLTKILSISLIFFCLIVILSILEEISFFKNLNVNFFFPYILTLLNAPITLFEIFPFIFLLSTQFLFYDLFKKDELNLLKSNGLSNLKIIKILFIFSIIIGIFTVSLYYSMASKLKFYYTDIKNNFSNDNKYLAVVTDSGLWLKDEIDNDTLIIKANYFKDNYLFGTGVKSFRKQCKKNKYYIIQNYSAFEDKSYDYYPGYTGIDGCSTHPHNYYFQLLFQMESDCV